MINWIFKSWKNFVSFIFAAIGMTLIVSIFNAWIQHPELTYMQIFKACFWYWLLAVVCLLFSSIIGEIK